MCLRAVSVLFSVEYFRKVPRKLLYTAKGNIEFKEDSLAGSEENWTGARKLSVKATAISSLTTI